MDKTTLALWTLVGACMVIVGICFLIGLWQLIQDGQDRRLRNRNIEGRTPKEPKS
jgi:hypothetical protein